MANAVSFDVVGYEAFRERATDPALSANEKAGFPDSYREGRSSEIFADICSKLPSLRSAGTTFLDIGPGCGELAHYLVRTSGEFNIRHTVIDSAEVLRHLPDHCHLTKLAGPFPESVRGQPIGPFDAILAYSVLQYVFAEGNVFDFVDSAIQLLGPSGAFLIGDIPNRSMRKRFLVSPNGRRYHKEHFPDHPEPRVEFNIPEPGQVDDSVILGIVARVRAAGLHAFILPQRPELPMSNRREDLLVTRP